MFKTGCRPCGAIRGDLMEGVKELSPNKVVRAVRVGGKYIIKEVIEGKKAADKYFDDEGKKELRR